MARIQILFVPKKTKVVFWIAQQLRCYKSLFPRPRPENIPPNPSVVPCESLTFILGASVGKALWRSSRSFQLLVAMGPPPQLLRQTVRCGLEIVWKTLLWDTNCEDITSMQVVCGMQTHVQLIFSDWGGVSAVASKLSYFGKRSIPFWFTPKIRKAHALLIYKQKHIYIYTVLFFLSDPMFFWWKPRQKQALGKAKIMIEWWQAKPRLKYLTISKSSPQNVRFWTVDMVDMWVNCNFLSKKRGFKGQFRCWKSGGNRCSQRIRVLRLALIQLHTAGSYTEVAGRMVGWRNVPPPVWTCNGKKKVSKPVIWKFHLKSFKI